MKLVIRTVLFHMLCILIFSCLYYYFRNDFKTEVKEEFTVLDYIFLSTTIQAGVGITDIYPIANSGKIIMIIQQFIMIMANIFTVYIFTI